MAVVSLDNTITIALSVRDRAASARWFSDMLGFQQVFESDEMGWTELATMTDGVTLGLGEQAEPAPGNAVPVFGIADIHAGRKAMENAGVKFDGDTMTMDGMVSLATFYDPDGNAFMLAQDLTKG